MPAKTWILFVGDVIGRPGRRAVSTFLPGLVEKYSPSAVIGNGENAAGGIGLTDDVCDQMLGYFNVITTGNHIWDKKGGIDRLENEPRLLRPANYPEVNPGRGTAVFESETGVKVGILNLQGRVFMEALECPFRTADKCLEEIHRETPIVVVDFHAEATSEKQALGWYLDGRVSALIGTHTHVQTADDKILPKGTAFISDVGMAGGYDSVIGIKKEQAVKRFLTSRPHRIEPAKGRLHLGAVAVEVDRRTGKALSFVRENIVGKEE